MAARVFVCVAGLALGLGSLAIAHGDAATSFAGRSWAGDLALLAGGWALLAAAALLAGRRARRVAALLAAAGCVWFIAEWDDPGVGSAGVFTAGLVLFAACPPLVAWAMLAYPRGRLPGWAARAVVATALVAGVLLLGLLPALFFDPQAQGCPQCPENLVLVTDDPELVESFGRAGLGLGLSSALAAMVLAGWTLARSSPARRRVVAPVAGVASAYLVLVAWTYALGLDHGFVGTGEDERRLWLGQAATLAGLAVAVVAGRVEARRTRASLAGIVVALGESGRPGGMRDELARALGDAELVVAYPVGAGRYADASGAAVAVPEGDDPGDRQATPLVRDGRPVAVLVHRRGLLDDTELVDEVASAARLALDNERLQAELRAQEADLRASRARIVEAGDAARRRLERDLHDGAQQRLVGLLLGLRLARTRLAREADERCLAGLDQAAVELQGAVEDLRDLARGLHPAVLSDEGLAAALESLAEGATTPVRLADLPDVRLAPPVESAAYRVAAEAVQAGATFLSAVRRDGVLVVDADTPDEPDRFVELEDRVGALDGRIRLDRPVGGGVRLRAEIPCG